MEEEHTSLLARIAYGAVGAVLGAIIGLLVSTPFSDAFLSVVLVGAGAIVGFLVDWFSASEPYPGFGRSSRPYSRSQ